MPRPTDSIYYYAAGVKVPLVVDGTLVAVHASDVAAGTGDRPQTTRSPVEPSSIGRDIGHGYLLVNATDVSPTRPGEADDAQPELRQQVFRSGDDTIIIALPEVRVAGDDQVLDRVREWIGAQQIADVEEQPRRGQLTVRPHDDSGTTAIKLANEIHERFRPSLSQARFLRIIRRPQ